ncbi:RDD family protein [Halostreptopolyspora alba]
MYPPDQPHPQQPGYGYPAQGPAPYPGHAPYPGQAPYGPMAQGGYQYPSPPGYSGGYAGPELASWGRRVGGYLIDYVIMMVMVAAIVAAFFGLAFGLWELIDPTGAGGQDPPPAFLITLLLLYPALFAAMFCYRWLPHASSGQTPGKRMVGIRLVKETTGQPVGKGPSAGRELVFIALSAVTCVGVFVDLLWPLWDGKNQTLHDKAVGGIVIRD